VAAEVDSLAADHGYLTAAIVDLPRAELQSQLLLLRLCAGPQPNYWLRALPLVWGARLAASVDRAAQGALRRLLTDARDSPAAMGALLDRAALPLSHGGLGIGGRTAVVSAAALASRIDALRAGRLYSPVLAAVADSLAALDGDDPTGSAPAPPSVDRLRPAGGRSPPPPAARPSPRPPGAAASVPALGASSGAAHGGAALPVVPLRTAPLRRRRRRPATSVIDWISSHPPSTNCWRTASDESFACHRPLHFPPIKPSTPAARGSHRPVSHPLLPLPRHGMALPGPL